MIKQLTLQFKESQINFRKLRSRGRGRTLDSSLFLCTHLQRRNFFNIKVNHYGLLHVYIV